MNILPRAIKEQLERHPGELIAQKYHKVTIAFADIVEYAIYSAYILTCSFTPIASKLGPSELVSMLNGLVCLWDSLLEHFNVEKVKTIGDWYQFLTF